MSLISNLIILIEKISKKEISKIRTNIPAEVISFDAENNTCSVQPSIMLVRADDAENLEPLALPQVDDVPVKQQGSGKFLLSVAPQVGSFGELRIFDRDISKFLQEGETQPPGSTRKFHFSDAIFDAGVYPLKDNGDSGKLPVPIATDRISLRLRDGTAEVSVLDDGKVEIKLPSGKTFEINSATDSVALASKVDSFISSMDTLIRTSWIIAPMDGGSALKVAHLAAFPIPPASTESEIIKVEK